MIWNSSEIVSNLHESPPFISCNEVRTLIRKKNSSIVHSFFFADQINDIATKWGDTDRCLLYYYFPVIEITVTVVWIVLIVISRRQGERRSYT